MIEALAMLSNEARECADEVYALGTYLWLFPNTVRYGKRRPGQWTDATRDKRRKRADREWWRRALNVWNLKQGNRAERRRAKRAHVERIAVERGLSLKSSEFTADLAMRVRLSLTLPRPGITHEDICAMGACGVEEDQTTHTVRVTMPADTSAVRCVDVYDEISARLPVHVALLVEAVEVKL